MMLTAQVVFVDSLAFHCGLDLLQPVPGHSVAIKFKTAREVCFPFVVPVFGADL